MIQIELGIIIFILFSWFAAYVVYEDKKSKNKCSCK